MVDDADIGAELELRARAKLRAWSTTGLALIDIESAAGTSTMHVSPELLHHPPAAPRLDVGVRVAVATRYGARLGRVVELGAHLRGAVVELAPHERYLVAFDALELLPEPQAQED